MIILKYSLAIFCLLLTGCSFFSSQKEKENPALTEYEYTTDDMQSGEESATVLPPAPKRSAMALYMDSLGIRILYIRGFVHHVHVLRNCVDTDVPADWCMGIRT